MFWYLPCSFLPTLLTATCWSPATAAAFPPALRAAARTMLLINAHRGWGAGADEGTHQPRRQRSTRQQAGKRAQQQRGVALPAEVVHRTLALASLPLLEWVPQLAGYREYWRGESLLC